MQESRLDTLKDKVNALGADTIMGAMSQVGEEYRDRVEKLEEAIAESNENEKATAESASTGDTLEAMKRMGYFRKTRPIVRDSKKIGRNEPCPCGAIDKNGKPKKYKNRCLNTGKYETTHYV